VVNEWLSGMIRKLIRCLGVNYRFVHADSLRVLAVALLLLTAGCGEIQGFISGDESLSFTPGEVHVREATVSSSPFTLASDESIGFERTMEAGGNSRTVEMNAHMVHLKRSYEGAPLGSLVILALPQVKILGQQIDVMEQTDPASLVSDAQGSSGDLQQQQRIGNRSVRILGQNRNVEVFSGTATREGESADARIYLATFKHEGDTIVAFGVIPDVASEDEGAVLDLLEAITYEG